MKARWRCGLTGALLLASAVVVMPPGNAAARHSALIRHIVHCGPPSSDPWWHNGIGNVVNISARNAGCAAARREIRSGRVLRSGQVRIVGWKCRRIGGGSYPQYGGFIRCIRGSQAMSFTWFE